MLEFKALPPEEHPGLRARVARDVARIRQSAAVLPLAMLRLIHGGLKQMADTTGAEAVAEGASAGGDERVSRGAVQGFGRLDYAVADECAGAGGTVFHGTADA